ncbi:hypothetical protein N7931_18280 [Catenovulum sp. 2E275]|uniref:hypothetical protein n=1 Tax=Catenovulum sp. 2E275 TaxID=2980497 RepID=UPI0021D118A9|nr:hypothetical protein [Catenovulum sp. 2E275]MCU4677570.1 hypothetical protein [Catenovulum sp. 2E275]
MFNLIVSGGGWRENRDTFPLGRTFEYTSDELVARFKPNGILDFESLQNLPTLFMEESWGLEQQYARVGRIIEVSESGGNISLEYYYDPEIAPISNQTLKRVASELDIADFEFSRTHWAIKNQNLYRVLLRHTNSKRKQPKVFTLNDPEYIEPLLVSAMMPFSPQFDHVYAALQQISEQYGLRCRRADDIWESPAVMQDVVSLIDKSKIVICDCTGRNPNVFYETGIAHALGREVILITQTESDIPFDLRHLRYVSYLNNGEGLENLKLKLEQRISALVGA